MLPNAKKGRPASSTKKLTFYLPSDAVKQLDELVSTLNMPRGSVIAQAIAKWYHNEPLIEKRRQNGDGHA